MISVAFHQKKRQAYQALLPEGSIGFLYSGEEKQEAGDENYPFSVYRNFYYLTGFDQPEAIYLSYRIGKETGEYLLIDRPTPMRERFEGSMPRADETAAAYGIAKAGYLDEFFTVLDALMKKGTIHTLVVDWENEPSGGTKDKLCVWVETILARYHFLKKLNSYQDLACMRRIKEPEEIMLHRRACQVTELGMNYMLSNLRPGMTEAQAEAYFDFIVKSEGCGHAFATVAAAGHNACILHYSRNRDVAVDGDLMLFDLGASSGYYCADVSRTVPVNGTFSARQKQLYEIVLKGLLAAIARAVPGQRKDELQLISRDVMAAELLRIGIIDKKEEIKRYYLHGSGHLIGLYTHDAGEADENVLVENMMFTLEPGLYFKEEGIGIRIEDTLLVTKNGCEVLTGNIPKTVEEIERFMAKERN